ncbi:hypothetical protein [Prosthecobacter fluviatilis]|uniref:Uncharacterized protein n=1 Tax=Prosthecobacter fluviatilis TaxID=445931 RepID=A0ABW0KY00_9BACT
MSDNSSLTCLENDPSISEMLPLIRESIDDRTNHVSVITEQYVCCFKLVGKKSVPPKYFEKDSEEELLKFAEQFNAGRISLENIRSVCITAPLQGESEKDYGGWYSIHFAPNEKDGITMSLAQEDAVLPLQAIKALAVDHHWQIEHKTEKVEPVIPKRNKPSSLKSIGLSIALCVIVLFLWPLYAGICINITSIAFRTSFSSGLAASILSVLLCACMVGLTYWTWEKRRSAGSTDAESNDPPNSSRKASRLGGHKPMHSYVLHWILKLCALLLFWSFYQLKLPESIAKNYWISLLISAAEYSAVASLLYWSVRLAVRSSPNKMTPNTTAMGLYLRSFHRDQQGSFNNLGVINALFGLNPNVGGINQPFTFYRLLYMGNPLTIFRLLLFKPRETAEEQLLGGLSRTMPVVAIGKPGDRLPTLGAQRSYVSDDEWQEAVLHALAKASLVIIQPGISKHIFWEIDRSLELVAKERILFWLSGLEQRQSRYDNLRIHLERKTGLKFPRHLGNHPFLAITEGKPCMLPIIESNAFTWPLKGSRVDFRRTLAPVLQNQNSQPVKPAPPPHFLSSTIRKITTFFAFCFWQLMGPLFCYCFMAIVGVSQELWTAWTLRRGFENPSSHETVINTTWNSQIQWSWPSGWVRSPAYDGDENRAHKEIELYGWSYGSGAFMLLTVLQTNPGLASLYERAPDDFLRINMNELTEKHGFKLGPVKLLDVNGRKWAQAEFTAREFDATWIPETAWLRIFTSGAKGVIRSTLGPEGSTTVWAFSPPTNALIARDPLFRLLDSISISVLNSPDADELTSKIPTVSMLRSWEKAEHANHRFDTLPELELTLPKFWNRENETTFTLDKTAVLNWSFRPAEITDAALKEAAERDIRRFELEKKVNCKILNWSSTSAGGLLECESKNARLLQRTWAGPMGVVSTRVWCAKEAYSMIGNVMRGAVNALGMAQNDAEEVAVSKRISALPRNTEVAGLKTNYVLHLPAGWTVSESSPNLDRFIVIEEPMEGSISVVVEDVSDPSLLSRDRWQIIADNLVKKIGATEGIASLQLRETTLFDEAPGHSSFRMRLFLRFSSGGIYQDTIYGVACAKKVYTVSCISSLKNPEAHDKIFDTIIREASWMDK